MNVQCHACIGGTNVGEDIRKLDYGQHVVSGTPGRVFGKLHAASYKLIAYWEIFMLFWRLLIFFKINFLKKLF